MFYQKDSDRKSGLDTSVSQVELLPVSISYFENDSHFHKKGVDGLLMFWYDEYIELENTHGAI